MQPRVRASGARGSSVLRGENGQERWTWACVPFQFGVFMLLFFFVLVFSVGMVRWEVSTLVTIGS